MGADEYDKTSSAGPLTILAPIIILGVAIFAAVFLSGVGSKGEVMETIKELCAKNQILQAFIASSVLGVVSYTVMLTGRTAISWLRGRTFCSVTISNKDESFEVIIDYIGKMGIVQSGCLVASTHKKKKTWKDWRTEFLMGARTAPRMSYQPANNNDVHIIYYDGCRILMHRHKGETVVTGWERVPTQMETLTLSSWGSHVAPLKKLIDDALKSSFEEQQDELSVFVLTSMWGGSWEKALSKKPRTIDSVILDEDLADGLLADARDFLHSSDWYATVGIPYRRGYLLYGPPGCGKTSFCQALAGALKLDVCMLTLTNKNLDDNGLAESLRDAPTNAIVLLEDVDAVFVDRAVQSEGGRGAGVTFSGLLNALDGVASQEGRLFFMTTNHIEKLDPALIRPGRCDIKVEVRRASRTQAVKLFSRFFEDEPEEHAHQFAEALPEYELSMATLQGYLLEHKTDPHGALAHVQRLLHSSKPLHVDRMPVFDHLRRVGLEGWARLFEYHGYALKADLRGLSIDTVKQWSGYLRIDARACTRMGLLLGENDKLLEEYQLIDMATAKEMFIAVFGAASPTMSAEITPSADTEGNAALVMPSRDSSAGSQPSPSARSQLARQHSSGLKRDFVDVAESEPLSRLADRFCAALQREGKAAASIWQVRHHLHLHAHSSVEAVQTAGVLIEPCPPCGSDALDVDELETYAWLRRAGLEKHAAALEKEGYATARALYGLAESVFKDDCKIKDQLERTRLTALVGTDAANARTLLSFTAPDYARLRSAFLAALAPEGALTGAKGDGAEQLEQHATTFANELSDGAGHGRISIHMLEAYLSAAKAKGAKAAAAEARAELLEHIRPAPPPTPEPAVPTEWVYTWLDAQGLKECASKLIEAGFSEKSDLTLEPRLGLVDLEKLGIEKPCDQRKVLKLIKAL